MTDPISVFISWSGLRSRAIARGIHTWLPDLFDGVSPWMSDRDIASGDRGLNQIDEALTTTKFCIVVVTAENQGSAWINYEAGAASRALGSSARVAPYLVDLASPAELTGPLAQFQARTATLSGTLALIETLADVARVPRETARRRFDHFWPALSDILDDAASTAPSVEDQRSERDMILEVVERLRAREHRLPYIDPSLPDWMERVAEELERPPTPIELRDGDYVKPFADLASELRQLAVAIESIS